MLSRVLKRVNLPLEVRGYDEPLLKEKLKSAYQDY
jgi:hypothetical protein